MTVSGAQTTFNNPVSFQSEGDVYMGYDLIFSNDTAAAIEFQSPGYIRTKSAYNNLDLTLSAANLGSVIVDDKLLIASSTTLDNQMPLLFREAAANGTNYVGFRATSTDITTNTIWTLPNADGSAGQGLLTDASGNLYWGSVGTAGPFDDLTDVDVTGAPWGSLVYYTEAGGWVDVATSSLGLPMGSGVAGQLAVWSDHDTLEASNTLQMAYGGTGKQLSPVAGGLVYTDANSMEVLGASTAGYILMSGGANAPQWISTSTFVMDSDFSSDGILTRFGSGNYISSTTLQIPFGGTGLQTAPAYGQLLLGNNTGGYTLTGTSSLGLIDGSGVAGLLAVWSDGNTLTSSNTLQMLYGGTGNTDFSAGSLVFSDGHILTQDNAHLYWDNTNNFLGLGTSSPAYLLDVYSSSTDYLARIYNTSTAASSSGLYIRTDGAGQLLTLNQNGTDVVTVSGAQTTFNNPVTFGSAGDVAMAYDLLMTNGTAGNIIFSGPGVIKTQSGYENLNLTLSAANQGAIIIDDMLSIASSTTLENQMPLRFGELSSNGQNYVGFRASSTLNGNYTWTLPTTQGSNGQVMMMNSSGNLEWSDPGAGSSNLQDTGYTLYPYDRSGQQALLLGGTGTSTAEFVFDFNGISWINNGNYFGIGTTTPDEQLTVAGDIGLTNQNEIRFYEPIANGMGYVGFKSTSTDIADSGVIWTLPGADGSTGQGLLTDGNGNLYWGSVGTAGPFDDLTDVDLTGASWGDLVYYTGAGGWVDVATSSLGLPMGSGVAGQLAVWSSSDTLTASDTLQLAYGGTGSQLSAPAADRIMFYDYDGGGVTWLDVGSGLSISGTTLDTVSTGGANYGLAGSLAFYEMDGMTATGTDITKLFWDNANNRLGIGTSAPATALTVMTDSGSQLRLAYDADNYVNFTVDSAGGLTIDGSSVSGSLLVIGDNTASDAGIAFDSDTYDFWMGIDDTDNAFHIGTSTTIGSSTLFTILNNGNVGIGSTTPNYNLTVNGSIYANDIYTSSSSYWMDGKKVLSLADGLKLYNAGDYSTALKASSTQTSDLVFSLPGADGTAGQVLKTDGNGMLYFAEADATADDWSNAGSDIYFTGGNVGIGTSTPLATLALQGTAGTDILNIASSTEESIFTINDQGFIGINDNTPLYTLELYNRTDSNHDDFLQNNIFDVYSGSTGKTYAALNVRINRESTTDSGTKIMGIRNYAQNDAGGTLAYLYGIYNETIDNGNETTNGYGLYNTLRNSDGSIQTGYGIYVDTDVTNTGYGIYIDDITAANDYGLYQAGSNDTNYFAGIVGIGTSTPQSELSVAGDLQLAGSDNYLNFSDGVGSTSYGFRDNGGTMQYKNTGGQWVNIGSAGSGGELGSMSDVVISGDIYGQMLYNDSGTWKNSGLITLDADNSFVGIGTATPAYTLDVLASTTDYLARIYNISTGTSSGLYVRTDGSGQLLTLNQNGTDVVTISGAQTTFNNPVTFGSAGDVAMAYDLLMTNGTAGNIIFSGPGVIKTKSTYENLDLTLSAANRGEVIVDDVLTVSGTTTLADLLYANGFDGRVGIGTSTPQSELSVAGDLQLAGSDNYLNFSDGVGSTSYGFRDNGGTMQYKNTGGEWVNIGSAGSGGILGSMSDVTISNAQDGQMLYYDSGTWKNSGLITLDAANSYVGIGTTGPAYTLDVYASTTDYLARIYNTSTGSSSGLYVRTDGSGQLLTLNAGGSDIFTVSEAASVFNNPVTFGSVGDVAMANDLIMTNDTAAYLSFQGPGYIRTDSANQNLNLTLIAANAGKVVVDDRLYITGSTTIYKADGSASDVMFQISTSTGIGFKIMGNGEAISDQAFNSGGADYAEYFYSEDNDLMPGEVVCVDITHNNAVKRCDRGEDGNVMGIVSTNPAIVGNNRADYRDNANYAIIGMLGQVDAKVSAENGPIRPGDSLTSASTTPGLAMRAEAGDPTVGVALEGLDAGTGEIKVLISRRNKSMTVEMVEQQITERIAGMEIEDEVAIMLQKAIDGYNIASSVEPIVNDQMASFSQGLTVAMDDMSGQLVTLAAGMDDVLARITALESDMAGIYSYQLSMFNKLSMIDAKLDNLSSTTDSGLPDGRIELTKDGNIVITNDNILAAEIASESQATSTATSTEPDVAVVEIVTAPETDMTAFVVNQVSDADMADFQADGVSVVNIADSGKVTVVGEMLVDGRLMVCSGGACGSTLETQSMKPWAIWASRARWLPALLKVTAKTAMSGCQVHPNMGLCPASVSRRMNTDWIRMNTGHG